MKIQDFKLKKQRQQKISMLTCYDYPSARTIAESSYIDCVLVGDSVAMVVHGFDTTVMATMDMMVMHTEAVARGLGEQFLIADLPFLCHRGSFSETIQHVKRLIQAGAHAIKIEGGDPACCETIANLVTAGIPIVGHIGLTPQSVHQLGYRVQGKDQAQAESLIQQAKTLENAGCIALVLECIPQALAHTITASLSIPTIGIGAGNGTDGQVLVWHDFLGLQTELKPRFVKHYAQAKSLILDAVDRYGKEVKAQEYPCEEHAF